MDSNTGKIIILIGVSLVVTGLIIYFLHDKLWWIGNLPGDIRVERANARFYFPFTTMLVFSLLFTVIVRLIRSLF